jgi:hypothetical protein
MTTLRSEPPILRPEICLGDGELAAIGRIAMIEARSMAMAASSLKGAEALSIDTWKATQKWQFSQISERLVNASKALDTQLYEAALKLEELRAPFQNGRNAIVHAAWGIGENGAPNAFDVKRNTWLRLPDIQKVLLDAESVDAAAYRCLWITAQLVWEGRIPSRADGPGPAMRLHECLVKW